MLRFGISLMSDWIRDFLLVEPLQQEAREILDSAPDRCLECGGELLHVGGYGSDVVPPTNVYRCRNCGKEVAWIISEGGGYGTQQEA